jgi:hypothetical protein
MYQFGIIPQDSIRGIDDDRVPWPNHQQVGKDEFGQMHEIRSASRSGHFHPKTHHRHREEAS